MVKVRGFFLVSKVSSSDLGCEHVQIDFIHTCFSSDIERCTSCTPVFYQTKHHKLKKTTIHVHVTRKWIYDANISNCPDLVLADESNGVLELASCGSLFQFYLSSVS